MSKEETKKLTNWEFGMYVLIGVAIALVYTLIFIVVVDLTKEKVQVSDFPLELFDEGYDILCIDDKGCLIKINENMTWGADQENMKFLVGSKNGKEDIKMLHNFGGATEFLTELTDRLQFNAEKYRFGYVAGLNYSDPLILLLEEITGIDETFEQLPSLFLIPYAHAQIAQYELELREIKAVQDCTNKIVSGASAYIPFTFKIFHDPTQDRTIEIVQQSRSFPVTQQTPQVMTFHTNYTDQYKIHFEINYDVARDRQVFLQYLSQGALTQTEQEKFNGNRFCMNLVVNTNERPKIPTREEMFGDAYFYFQQIPVLVEGFNRNSLTTGSSITYQWLISAGVIVAIILLVIQNAQNKKSFSFKLKEVDELVGFASEREEKDQERFEDIKKIQEAIVNNQEKIIEGQKKDLKQYESKAEEIKTDIKEGTKKISKIRSILHKPKKKEPETEEQEEVVEEKIKDETVVEKTEVEEKPKISIEKMDPLTKEILNKINPEKSEADFKAFTYQDLTQALAWVNEFIKQSAFKKISEEKRQRQLKMQTILHAGAIRKWEKEHKQ